MRQDAPKAGRQSDPRLDTCPEHWNAGDFEASFACYLPIAEEGHAGALYAIGLMFQQVNGVAQDFEQARTWWEKARDNGVARDNEALSRLPD